MDAENIQQSPASAIGTAFLANGGAPQGDTDSNHAPAPSVQPDTASQPSAAAPVQPTVDHTTAKHNLIARFFHNLTQSGSGSSASQMWRSIIGGALVGMGAAENAPVVARGPYGDVQDNSVGGAASRGFRAGQGQVEQQQDRQRKQAQQQKEEQRRDAESKIQQDDA